MPKPSVLRRVEVLSRTGDPATPSVMTTSSQERPQDSGGAGAIGLLAALPGELGDLEQFEQGRDSLLGVEVRRLEIEGRPVIAAVGGVGKVSAAGAASAILSMGAGGLLVVGTCGGLRRSMAPGDLVHCASAFQADLGVREGRAHESHPAWREAWQRVSPGIEGRYLTADRAVMGPLRRLRLARAFPGPCVADMETAAAAAVAARAGVPWAALRVVTDRAGLLAGRVFAQNYPTLAGVPADTVPALLRELP